MKTAVIITACALLAGVMPAGTAADATAAPATQTTEPTPAAGAPASATPGSATAPKTALTATGAAIQPGDEVIRVTAKCFAYDPDTITVHVGHPVVLELVSLDHHHGFSLPDFNQRADVLPGLITRLRFVPGKVGSYAFACDVFCGSGHDDMSGTLEVKP